MCLGRLLIVVSSPSVLAKNNSIVTCNNEYDICPKVDHNMRDWFQLYIDSANFPCDNLVALTHKLHFHSALKRILLCQ